MHYRITRVRAVTRREVPSGDQDAQAYDYGPPLWAYLLAVLHMFFAFVAFGCCILGSSVLLDPVPPGDLSIEEDPDFACGMLIYGLAICPLSLCAAIGLPRGSRYGYFAHIAACLVLTLTCVASIYAIPMLASSLTSNFRSYYLD